MQNSEYQQILDQVDSQMLQLSDTVAQLSVAIESLMEENNKLRISNMEIRDRLMTQSNLSDNKEEQASPSQQASGRESLQQFYNEGIHICHEFFGSRRSPDHQCLFCQEIIQRLTDNEA